MVNENLSSIISQYISNFERNDNKLWSDTVNFRLAWDDAKNAGEGEFSEKLNALQEWTSCVDNSSMNAPFRFLCECSAVEPLRVQNCLNELFSDDGGSITAKQSKIAHYVAETESLRLKYHPDSRIKVNDQRSAMALLWLYDPDNNYYLSPRAAKSFAKYIGLNEKWGTNTNFKLKIYYQFCDEVVTELRANETLLSLHRTMREGNSNLHPDRNLHILLADLIASTSINPTGKERG